MAEIETIAREFAGFLTTAERREGERIVVKTEDAPEWVAEIIQAIHGDTFPDDWTYATISECADYIVDNGDDGEQPEADIYTRDLLAWPGGYPNAVAACDDAVDKYGPCAGLIETIRLGQSRAIGAIHRQLLDALQERADATGDDAEEDEA